MTQMNYFHHPHPFPLEGGSELPGLTIGYHSYGRMNDRKDNVVWICHALTANSDAAEWWPGVVGAGCVVDPEKYFMVCANRLGSCYGATGPLRTGRRTARGYFGRFPLIPIRDMVRVHQLLSEF